MALASSQAASSALIGTLRWRALSLGAANAVDYALQVLLPMVLVRYLDAIAFGEYRLLWLAVGTVLPLATLSMPSSLYYFLPRSDPATRRLYINQTMLFLSTTGVVAAWAVSSWNPWLPQTLQLLETHGALVPLFVGLWVIAALLDRLPSVDERVALQTTMVVTLSIVRVLAIAIVAFVTQAIAPVLIALVAFAVLKVALLGWYIARHHAVHAPILKRGTFAGQLKYAAPIGVAGALYALRTQADQWVAAALFPLALFAAFSIASVMLPLMHLFRQSVNYAFLPSMSRHEAAGNIRGMLELNSQGNVTVATVVCPVMAFVFVFATDLVTIVYTPAYVSAAPVMQMYILGMAALLIELSTITMLLRLAPFVMLLNALALAAAVPLNWLLAQHVGLPGAAAGSVLLLYVDRAVTLSRISRSSNVPIRNLQNWGAIARPILFSIAAAVFAWWLVQRYVPADDSWLRVTAGAIALFGVYGTFYGAWRLRSRRVAVRRSS